MKHGLDGAAGLVNRRPAAKAVAMMACSKSTAVSMVAVIVARRLRGAGVKRECLLSS
jgi:hypothetical protein